MGRRIAVTVDGSPASENALRRAIEIARVEHSTLTGVFVIDTGWADFIGNDWQSSRNARRGFLDYILREQREHASSAQNQFAAATQGLEQAEFSVLVGEPANALVKMMDAGDADILVVGERVFQVCGRPSVRKLARTLAGRIRQPVVIC